MATILLESRLSASLEPMACKIGLTLEGVTGIRSELVTTGAPVCVPHGAHTGIFDWGCGCQRDTFHRDHYWSFSKVCLLPLSPRPC